MPRSTPAGSSLGFCAASWPSSLPAKTPDVTASPIPTGAKVRLDFVVCGFEFLKFFDEPFLMFKRRQRNFDEAISFIGKLTFAIPFILETSSFSCCNPNNETKIPPIIAFCLWE